jgi:two-component system, OmpR family, response regulator RegX3
VHIERGLVTSVGAPARPVALLIATDTSCVEPLRYYLHRAGFAVAVMRLVEGAIPSRTWHRASVTILDRIHGSDGGRTAASPKQVWPNPILVLGATVEGDASLDRPITGRRLAAKLETVLELASGAAARPADPLVAGPVSMDISRHEVRVGGKPVFLRVKEFDLLETFLRRPGRVLSRDFLAAAAWGIGVEPLSNTLDVHVWRLRQKLETDPSRPRLLETVRRRGYRLSTDPARSSEALPD